MPEDRFRDLGPERRGRGRAGQSDQPGGGREWEKDAGGPSAAERLADLDDREPEPSGRSGPVGTPPRPRSQYSWVVGVAALILIILAVASSFRNEGEGFSGPEAGSTLPEFAAPSAAGASNGDANVRQEGGEGSEQEGVVPACEVQGEDVVNICELRDGPVAVTFVVSGCEDALDRIDALRSEHPGVNFVGVVSGDSREDLAETLAEHDWGFPVALDPDAAVFNLYRVGDCPTTVIADAGGEVRDTLLAPSEQELEAALEELEATGAGGGGAT